MSPLLATIWQTGTQYMLRQFPGARQVHCYAHMVEQLDDLPPGRIITTFRDPYLVAASWANRYHWPEVEGTWREQWEVWAEIVEMGAEVFHVADFDGPVVKPTPHDRGAKRAYQRGDMAAYFRYVPESLVEFALTITDRLGMPRAA